MPETSPEFHNLQLAFATAKILLADLPAHDIVTDDHRLRLRSYLLICHAAIEEYLERLSMWALKESRRKYQETGIIPHPLISLKSYYSFSGVGNSDDGGPQTVHNFLGTICDRAIEKHESELTTVHGIKTKDQDAIFLPLGISMFTFDRILSQNLNSVGKARGEAAHSFRIRQRSPKIELERRFENIERLMLPFDNEVCARIGIGLN
ncbi:hypothetical protein FY140_02935 [Agrobacterium tumefaciens]|uniref:HEPN domain-containing protein n=1 Tax=Agrobacterium tumefaciens TaxID=358 RepID=UPI0021D38215|nr:HEPN domain-containing protein [Agrobacterium tumefaciens]UXT19743.1 hypothetical protein FY140_02935 [Agrobacterium tumefaciens]